MKRIYFILCCMVLFSNISQAKEYFIETESFDHLGGWKVDQQFMDVMGSPYLIAHGLGTAVEDASDAISITQTATYYIYVRTYNWTSPWYQGKGPGRFTLLVNGKSLSTVAGCEGSHWMWQYMGAVKLNAGRARLVLHDITGFDGRCDAIYLSTTKQMPPQTGSALDVFRAAKGAKISTESKTFDFVVAGGGIAGICAAVAAARQGLKVALVNDRPVIGGNNSSEVRVHLGGRIELAPYQNLGNLLKEFAPTQFGNAMPAANYQDEKKMNFILQEKNISLFTDTHITAVQTKDGTIQSLTGRNIITGDKIIFRAPLFCDCTGDGSVGALASAEFMMGREAQSATGEERAVETPDKMTMGTSVQWYSVDNPQAIAFPEFQYGLHFNDSSAIKINRGDWDWETGMQFDQMKDAEYIRDYGLLVVYSNWSFLKNHSKEKAQFANRKLDWVAYIAGKRESRRLVGDYVLNANDIINRKIYPDATACTSWTIDLHEPNRANSKFFPGHEFLSTAVHTKTYPYPIPFRCLYSHNIGNLLMAGRNVSVTHVALGTVRVMRTGAMLGEVAGLAASVCHQHATTPRGVYTSYLGELKQLMKKGAGKTGLPNNQTYNMGSSLIENK